MPSRAAALLSCCALFLLAAPGAAAQPVTFGAADDPRERGRRGVPWPGAPHVALRAGPSLVGSQWRGHVAGVAATAGPAYAARLEGALRGDASGPYEEDTDEAYELLRLLDYARYLRSTGAAQALYGRAGPLQQVTLGPAGHLVSFFRSDAAYDERTVGLEAFAQATRFSAGAFTDNVLLDGVTGGRVAARPFAGSRLARGRPALATAEVGVTAATDLGLLPEDAYADSLQAPTAFALDASYDATRPGGPSLTPFASVAAFRRYGWGAGAGATVESHDAANLVRFALRLGLFYSSDQFVPGAFGPLYAVSNPRARIADEAPPAEERAPSEADSSSARVAPPLSEVDASAGWRLGLRLLLFERLELTSSYYGHLSSQDLSRYHLRLFFRTRRGTQFYARLDRAGLADALSVFSAADEQTAVTFNVDYRLPFDLGPAGVWAHLRARYAFEALPEGTGGIERYRPERHFEPAVGVRLRL